MASFENLLPPPPLRRGGGCQLWIYVQKQIFTPPFYFHLHPPSPFHSKGTFLISPQGYFIMTPPPQGWVFRKIPTPAYSTPTIFKNKRVRSDHDNPVGSDAVTQILYYLWFFGNLVEFLKKNLKENLKKNCPDQQSVTRYLRLTVDFMSKSFRDL